MARQKCGTCRYFQDLGLAGSGWCHHPERKTSSDVMIMVRRNELACRDEWEHSLWEGGPPLLSGSERPPFDRPPGSGPVAPASADSLRALLNQNPSPGPASSEGEDVLLSEARIVSDAPRQAPGPMVRPTPAGGFDPRTAIFRAREAHREKARAKAAAARQLAAAEAVALEATADPGRQRSELGGASLQPPASDAEAAAEARDESVAGSKVGGADELQAAPIVPQQAGDASQFTPGRPATASRAGEPRLPAATAFEPSTSAAFQAGASETQAEADVCAPEVASAPVELGTVAPEEQAPQSLEEDVPSWFRVDLPRVCRSCRDYRPSADGQRGWCANAWAFTHSRLVQADEAAPCQSAIGDWWVPVDDIWLVAADVSAHGRATPLLDRLVGGEDTRRRRS